MLKMTLLQGGQASRLQLQFLIQGGKDLFHSSDRSVVLLPLSPSHFLLLASLHSSLLKPLPTCLPVLEPFPLSLERLHLDWTYSIYPYLRESLHLNLLIFLHPSFACFLSSFPYWIGLSAQNNRYCSPCPPFVRLSSFYLFFRSLATLLRAKK